MSYLVQPDRTPRRARFPAIDAHNHLWGAWDGVAELTAVMDDCGIAAYCDLTADLDIHWSKEVYRIKPGSMEAFRQRVAGPFPGRFYPFTTAGLIQSAESPLFDKPGPAVEAAVQKLRADAALGALGLKLTKELGLLLKDTSGQRIPINAPYLQPIWEEAARLGLPVLIHTGDPFGFFQPATEENEHYRTLQRFKDWDFSDRDRWPTFQKVQEEFRDLVANNPSVRFISPHLCNWPENLSYVSNLLDEFPNLWMDFSARVDELGRQPYRSREFFMKHQDRLLFGIDMPASREVYRFHFRFLETFDEFFEPPFYDGTFGHHRWHVHGIGLPDDVLLKIYQQNILRLLPALHDRIPAHLLNHSQS